jgi:hypothetical protein
MWNKKKFQVFLKWETNSFLYQIEAWTTLQCKLNQIWLELNWIELNWIKIKNKDNEMKIGKKDLQNLLVNMVVNKFLKNET